MKIVVVDYGMGNLKSICSVLKYLSVDEVVLSNDFYTIKESDKILLPGVGSFSKAMEKINKLGLRQILDEVILIDKKPILGICLGMQILCNYSEEGGKSKGLGYINAECKKFNIKDLKVPHVGFNQVTGHHNSKLYGGLNGKNDFYFTHSYRLQSNENLNQSICNYGEDFIASYEKGNIAGVQFHPELSQTNGLKLIKNFIENF
jgi:imidazole glycerol-phosphate synthase subunit HisH